jgi:hypothetical protein
MNSRAKGITPAAGLAPLAAIIISLAAAGCQNPGDPGQPQGLKDQLESIIKSARGQLGRLKDNKTVSGPAKQLTGEAEKQLEKMFVFEYKVAEVDRRQSAEALQKDLDALGTERWECFHMEPKDQKLLVFCKRHPKSYLRYLVTLF